MWHAGEGGVALWGFESQLVAVSLTEAMRFATAARSGAGMALLRDEDAWAQRNDGGSARGRFVLRRSVHLSATPRR